MDEELYQIEENNTWELVPRPKGKNVISTKWVFKNKLNEDKNVVKNKARLVSQLYTQVEGIDFKKNLCPYLQVRSYQDVFGIFMSQKFQSLLDGFHFIFS